jgi:hypothetical protein
MATPATPLSSQTAITGGSAAIACPASAQASRQMVRIYNNTPDVVYYGSTGVTASTGIPIQPGQYDDLWLSGSIFVFAVQTGTIVTLEMA